MISNNLYKKKEKVLNLFKEKKFKDVIKFGIDIINDKPKDSQLIYILGLASINLQNFEDAEKYFQILLSTKKIPEIYYIFGNIQKKLKKYENAISSFENAISLNPNFSEAYNNLGNTKKLINKRDEAVKLYKKAISLKQENIEALFNLAIILKEDNNYLDLIDIYKKILKLNPKNVKTIYNLGSAYLFLGNISKGRECFQKAIEFDNLHIPSFRNYISITRINKKNEIFRKLENIKVNLVSHDYKILLKNALSKGYFDQDNFKLAFKNLSESNLLKKQNSNFSIQDQKNKFEYIKELFLNLDSEEIKFSNVLKSIPIFIVGMPRSGTSLIEQVLSSHSQIYGAGELNFLEKIIDRIGLKKPNNIKTFFSDIRNYYYEQITKTSNKKFIIDKLPLNFRWIGFIIKSFPEAKIIHISRNPMAICWSNYKTHFVDKGMDFNLSQKDVAIYYSMYSNLMEFWKKQYNNKIFELNYETFVHNFEEQTKKILEYLNINWEENLKNYRNNNRIVATASYLQVRETIMKNTSNQWKNYSEYLKEMQKTLTNQNIKY